MGLKQPERVADQPIPPSAQFKEAVELYLYSPYVDLTCYRVILFSVHCLGNLITFICPITESGFAVPLKNESNIGVA